MGHAIHRLEQFEVVGPYTLKLRFADQSEQQIDFRPVLEGEVFGPLQDLEVFNTVELDTTFGTLQWPNGADFDPETLHDWPKYCAELAAMARRWAETSDPIDPHPDSGGQDPRRHRPDRQDPLEPEGPAARRGWRAKERIGAYPSYNQR